MMLLLSYRMQKPGIISIYSACPNTTININICISAPLHEPAEVGRRGIANKAFFVVLDAATKSRLYTFLSQL